jgi:hypothetical protein
MNSKSGKLGGVWEMTKIISVSLDEDAKIKLDKIVRKFDNRDLWVIY